MSVQYFQIRDPIHGVIFVSKSERNLIDSSVFQRLRNIKQVGFADFAFPSATHSRYSHSLGAMHVASKIFDTVFSNSSLPKNVEQRFRQALRLASLFHDIGHPPLSHTTEMMMPTLDSLFANSGKKRKAKHEDFTQKTILNSPLAQNIDEEFSFLDLNHAMIAALLDEKLDQKYFVYKNDDFGPLLRQIISSEIDADRMDYLLRDSFFCGVNYGKYDHVWLINNLCAIKREEKVYLALNSRAIFAFEDFLLSRFHMFASVYLHHTPVIMEKMLSRFFAENPSSFVLPSDIDAYLKLDDLDLWQVLRNSSNAWAQRIVQRRPYIVVDEGTSREGGCDRVDLRHEEIRAGLKRLGIDYIGSRSKSVLSNYFGRSSEPIFVKEADDSVQLLENSTPLFTRYRAPAEIFRIYVDIGDKENVQRILKSL